MAQQVLVQLVDDLDGTETADVATVQFGLDGVSYEIDLSAANADRLRASVEEFVGAGRRTGGRLKRTTVPGAGPASSNSEAAQVREWALTNGYELSARGRIPSYVVDAYRQAQAEAQAPKKKPATRARPRTRKG